MKIRTKFTLWISLSALSTALLASFFVYSELLEEPYKMIDRELFAVASTAIWKVSPATAPSLSVASTRMPWVASAVGVPARPIRGEEYA